ncbi:hypothetical protein BI330_10220 [Mycobacterium sp. CBMA 623]|nr:hypothetical protein [Mycobacteroides sp. CBMA 326]
MCGSFSAEIEHKAGFVSPSAEDLDKGYEPNGAAGADPNMCDRMTNDLSLMFSTWSETAYAQKHGPGSPAYSNATTVTIDGRSAAESHDSDHDCRLEFHVPSGKIVVMTAHTRTKGATPACSRLIAVATTLSSVMPH